jgi:NADH-quinone oxidoreductase subunit G
MKLAREPLRYSGRTAMRANISVHEPRTPQDKDTAFAFSMEGYSGSAEPRQQVPFAWSPGWNSPQAWNKFQDEVGGHLRAGDPGTRLIESTATAELVRRRSARSTRPGHLAGRAVLPPVRQRRNLFESRPGAGAHPGAYVAWPSPKPTAWASTTVPC